MEKVKDQVITDNYAIYNSDCMLVMPTLKDNSIDLSVYSPPFAGLYNYSSSENDFSNCESKDKFLEQINPSVAKNYQFDRWVNKLTGKGFNAPDPPKNAKREYYQRIEAEQKEKNKLAYERRQGIVSS